MSRSLGSGTPSCTSLLGAAKRTTIVARSLVQHALFVGDARVDALHERLEVATPGQSR